MTLWTTDRAGATSEWRAGAPRSAVGTPEPGRGSALDAARDRLPPGPRAAERSRACVRPGAGSPACPPAWPSKPALGRPVVGRWPDAGTEPPE